MTAMVHKDQAPDTPKSVLEASKEVTFDDRIEDGSDTDGGSVQGC